MAQKMVDDTNAYKSEVEASIEVDKKAMRNEYIERARRRIDVTSQTEDKFLSEGLADIDNRYQSVAGKLNETYETNKQTWVNELYKRVIGG